MEREKESITTLHLVDLIEEIKGGGVAALNREDESQSDDGLLASGELRHEERLSRSHERHLANITKKTRQQQQHEA